MFKNNFFIGALVVIVGVLGFLNLNKGSVEVKELISTKNPYSRKPASIVEEKFEITKTELELNANGIDSRVKKLDLISSCYLKKCEFSNTDSREYDLSVGHAIKKELLSFYEEVLENEKVDERISKVARNYLKVPNGHVKEAALLVLSTQPPSQENLSAVLEHVMNYHDANLVGLALMELEKYKDNNYSAEINANFINNFKSGSLLVKEALAKGMYKFVTEESKSDFESLLNEMPKNSKVRQNLKASLDRYQYKLQL